MASRYSTKRIEQALRENPFNLTKAAASLGMSRQTLYERISQEPELQMVRKDLLSGLLDKAESVIDRALGEDDRKVAMFVAERLGKDNWARREEVTGADGDDFEVTINWDGHK